MKNIFIAIRYSIVLGSNAQWSKNEGILSDERMNIREDVFENVTFPSLINQNLPEDVCLNVIILISDLLSIKRIRFLQNLFALNKNNNIKFFLEKVSHEDRAYDDVHRNYNNAINSCVTRIVDNNENSCFATVRLDDDDALSVEYCRYLSKYINSNYVGIAISFATGIQARYANGKIYDMRNLYFPKIALGLAFINKVNSSGEFACGKVVNVYNLGDHTRIDEKTPVLVDASKYMYVRTISGMNDSNVNSQHDELIPFSFSEEMILFKFLKKFELNNSSSHQSFSELCISKTCSPANILINKLNKRIKFILDSKNN